MVHVAGFNAHQLWLLVWLTIFGRLKSFYPMFPFLTTLERETTKKLEL